MKNLNNVKCTVKGKPIHSYFIIAKLFLKEGLFRVLLSLKLTLKRYLAVFQEL